MAEYDDDTLDDLMRKVARVPELPVGRFVSPSAPSTGAPAPLDTVKREDYATENEIGRGGMGRILLAQQKRLGRTVAVKELLTRDPDAEARFVREALITAGLQHPSIVPVHDAGRWPSGEPFYVMKLISGQPFTKLILEKQTAAERVGLVPTVLAVAEAMAYAHSRGVIHRDLKPSNVLVGEFGETLVIDWGLAKRIEPDTLRDINLPPTPPSLPKGSSSDSGQTHDGAVVGTPDFMSPEQAAGVAVDARTDVYALGCLLYVTLAGRPPYDSDTPLKTLQSVLDGPPKPLRERQPDLPPELYAIVDKAMARKPEERYPTASEMANDLRRFQTGQMVAAHRYSTRALLKRWVARHRTTVLTIAAAVVAATVMGAWNVRRIVRERDRADRERVRAEQALHGEAMRTDELILAQARAHLEDEPTHALAWLKRLRAGSPLWPQARPIAVEAVERGTAARLLKAGEPVRAIGWAPDGARLAVVGGSGRVSVIGALDGKIEQLGVVPGGARVAFSRDGHFVAAAGDELALWNLDEPERRLLLGHRGRITALAFDGADLVSAGEDATVRRWRVADLSQLASCTIPSAPSAIAIAGERIAVRYAGGAAVCLGPTMRVLGKISGGEGVAISRDGERVASGASGGVWIWHGGAKLLPLPVETHRVAFSPDAQFLAAAARDGTVHLWNLSAGTSEALAHPGDASNDLDFALDGSVVAATRGVGVRVWRPLQPVTRKLRTHPFEVRTLRLAPDAKWLAAAGDGDNVWVWRLAPLSVPNDPHALGAWLEEATSVRLEDLD